MKSINNNAKHIVLGTVTGFMACFMFPTTTFAQTSELSDVFACRDEPDALKRLACYDSAVGRFEIAQEKGEIVTISKKQIENVERDSFGFSIPSLPKLGGLFGGKKDKTGNVDKKNDLTAPVSTKQMAERPKPPEALTLPPREVTQVKEVEYAIRKTQSFGYKKTRFFLENGQVWEQVDGGNIRVPKTRGDSIPTAQIQRAALGSFLLRVNGKGRAIRVRRVR